MGQARFEAPPPAPSLAGAAIVGALVAGIAVIVFTMALQ